MPQDWFDSIAVKSEQPKVDPWFDQFATPTPNTKSEEKPKEKTLKEKLLTGSPFDPTDTRPLTEKIKDVGKRMLFGDEKTPSGLPIIGKPTDKNSLLPENITGKHEPEDYWSGYANSLYKDYVRPAVTPDALLQGATLGGLGKGNRLSPTAENNAILTAADKGLPIDPKPVPMPENFGNPQGAKNAALGLPPASGPEIIPSSGNTPRFISGEYGLADANKTYPKDIGTEIAQPGSLTQPSGRVLDDSGKLIPNRSPTILPRETEGITNLPGPEAARLGTGFGNISKIETSSPKSNIISIDKVRQGSPVQLPSVERPDIGNVGRPDLPYQLESAPKQSKSGLNTLDAVEPPGGNTIPREPNSSAAQSKNNLNTMPSNGVPLPGQATAPTPPVQPHSISKDINSIRQELGSVDKTLASRPETAPIVESITGAQDTKTAWIAQTERDLAGLTKGLGKAERRAVGDMLNRPITPQDPPQLAAIATKARQALDAMWQQIPAMKGKPVGYIQDYLTHIQESGDPLGAKAIWENVFKKPYEEILSSAKLDPNSASGNIQNVGQGLGSPNSPFVKSRTGALKNIELDTNKVFPAYVESIAKLIHDAPAVEQAKKVIEQLPAQDIYGAPSKLKALAEWYVKNYTHYDAQAALGGAWNKYTNAIMKTTARSMLGFSTGLQTLHLARIPMNLYPELGEKYLLHGAAQVIKNPKAAYQEAASLGLLQNEVRPFAFKTVGEKVDSLTGFFQAADFLDKSIGYHGFKQKFLDAGMNAQDAMTKALAASKKASLTIDPARSIRAFSPDPGIVGTAAKLSAQFKQVPVKIIEQYIQIAAAAKADPKQAARAMVGLGLTAAAAEAGFHTLHVSPRQFAIDAGGASFSVMRDIYREAMKGNVTKAVADTALWLVPGGRSIKRQVQSGLSMFDNSNRNIPPPR